MEESFFFENEGTQLFGVLYFPPDGARGPRAAFVFCNAFGDEAFRTHREMVVYARRLSREGFIVLRFDYRGCGDSGGEFEDFTLTTQLDDIRTAIELVRQKGGVETIGLLGLRLGGTLAAAAAAQDPRVNRLVLWAPIFYPAKYLDILKMSKITHELTNYGKVGSSRKSMAHTLQTGGRIDLAGTVLSQAVYQELLRFDPWSARQHDPEHILIVGMPGDTTKPSDLELLKGKYQKADLISVDEKLFWFDKIFQNPTRLYDATSDWLRTV